MEYSKLPLYLLNVRSHKHSYSLPADATRELATRPRHPRRPTLDQCKSLNALPDTHRAPRRQSTSSSATARSRQFQSPYKQNCRGCQNLPSQRASARHGRVATLTSFIEELGHFEVETLKQSLRKPRDRFSTALKPAGPERIEEIRQNLARSRKFKSLEFKKDVLTQKGVLKILGKKG